MDGTGALIQRWTGDANALQSGAAAMTKALDAVAEPLFVVDAGGETAFSHQGGLRWGPSSDAGKPKCAGLPLLGYAPPLLPSRLGDGTFKRDLGLRYPYIVGAMANGITSVEMVTAAGEAGMVGFFGAGGLSLAQIETAIGRLQPHRGQFPIGFNLIHSPATWRWR